MTKSPLYKDGQGSKPVCLQCARLAEENASLRQELSYEVDHQLTADIREAIGCSPQQAEILALLYRAVGRHVRAVALLEAMGSASDATVVARVQIAKLRPLLPADSIDAIYGRGYRLTDAGRAFVEGLTRKAAA